jgi:hypothetical protein
MSVLLLVSAVMRDILTIWFHHRTVCHRNTITPMGHLRLRSHLIRIRCSSIPPLRRDMRILLAVGGCLLPRLDTGTMDTYHLRPLRMHMDLAAHHLDRGCILRI